jgi:hypothetical protein
VALRFRATRPSTSAITGTYTQPTLATVEDQFEQAKEEALRGANRAVEDLNALGLNYRLVMGAAPTASKNLGKKPEESAQAERSVRTRRPG